MIYASSWQAVEKCLQLLNQKLKDLYGILEWIKLSQFYQFFFSMFNSISQAPYAF